MRFFNIVIIFIFMAMLMLPLIFVDLSQDRVSVQENRMLANFPKLADLKHNYGKFIHDFDAWFKDSIGFREQLLKLYNISGINSWYSGVQYKEGKYVYLVGENGHHYYAGENGYLIQRYQGEKLFPDEQLSSMANKLEEVKVYLDNKGIPFIIMFCALKEEIYPEFYPKAIKRSPEPIPLDVITAYIQEHAGIDTFNIRQVLLAEKNNYLLYYKNSFEDFHYTEIGAFFAYRELMKHINVYFPEITPYELEDIEISYDNEGIPDVSLKTKPAYKKLDASFFDDVEVGRPFSWENAAYENTNTNLPVILFFSDSFSGFIYSDLEKKYIKQFIASHFGKAIFIHITNFIRFQEYVEKYNPDIVVFEAMDIINAPHIFNLIPELTVPPPPPHYARC